MTFFGGRFSRKYWNVSSAKALRTLFGTGVLSVTLGRCAALDWVPRFGATGILPQLSSSVHQCNKHIKGVIPP